MPYFNINQIESDKLLARAMIGGISNYNGKFILIQSWSFQKKYDEQEAIKFLAQ